MAALLASTACTDTESATNLNPDGPPMIEQVILTEAVIDASGNENDNRVFAFGTLPGLDATQEHAVSSAAVTGQKLRIVFDELLQGNRLEEISCNANISPEGAWSTVPDGATPDDIAKCTVAPDVLKASCFGDHAVCICQLDGGCIVGSNTVNKGDPVGVEDLNQDGAADHHRFLPDSVSLMCGAATVKPDPGDKMATGSYWYPSGDQQPPAVGGVEAIGPAIVFLPQGPMPTNTTCGLKFAANVVDKSGIQICAPPGGRTTACSGNIDKCVQSCTPGDTSAFTFKTAPLTLSNQSFTNNEMGVDKGSPIGLVANTLLDTTTVAGAISMTQNGTAFTTFTVTTGMQAGKTSITITANGGAFAANSTYVLTVATTLKDSFGQPLVMPAIWTFTTGA